MASRQREQTVIGSTPSLLLTAHGRFVAKPSRDLWFQCLEGTQKLFKAHIREMLTRATLNALKFGIDRLKEDKGPVVLCHIQVWMRPSIPVASVRVIRGVVELSTEPGVIIALGRDTAKAAKDILEIAEQSANQAFGRPKTHLQVGLVCGDTEPLDLKSTKVVTALKKTRKIADTYHASLLKKPKRATKKSLARPKIVRARVYAHAPTYKKRVVPGVYRMNPKGTRSARAQTRQDWIVKAQDYPSSLMQSWKKLLT